MALRLRFFTLIFDLTAILSLAVTAGLLRAQEHLNSPDAGGEQHPVVVEKPPSQYKQPTEQMKLDNYLFDAFGPYPLAITTVVAGYHQARRTPPDWREGWPGYGMRYGSDFGTAAAGVTAKYLAAEALHEDTLYYRCACKGVWPRIEHALVSTLIARRGPDGHNALAVPAIIAPYAGTFTAVYGWYPDRYGAKDAFRMGNYGLMEYAIGNIGLEFLPSLTHGKGTSLMLRLHLDNRHAARAGESAP